MFLHPDVAVETFLHPISVDYTEHGTFDSSFFLSLFSFQRSHVYPRKKPLESGLGRKAVKLGYLCHFVKLLSVLIYVEGVYARAPLMSNLAVDKTRPDLIS